MFAEKTTVMNILLTSLLILHIVSGFTALGFGLAAILSKPGQRIHLLTGRVFYRSMLLIAFSAVLLSSFRLNLFLLLIAFFALYNNVSGYRSIRNKSLRPSAFDWTITAIGLITGIVMISTLNIVLLVFGSISLSLAIGDCIAYTKILGGKEAPRFAWLVKHIGMMMGAYIATFTAFVVVNIDFVQPSWIPWLAPTAIGVPLLVYWQRKYANGLTVSSK
jgi:uncharacterized membrane protein